jgi:hypothetical protein
MMPCPETRRKNSGNKSAFAPGSVPGTGGNRGEISIKHQALPESHTNRLVSKVFLGRLLKNSASGWLWEGQDFSRAVKLLTINRALAPEVRFG